MAIKFFAFFFSTISTFGCFWSQAVTSGCPTMRCGRLPSRSDVNIIRLLQLKSMCHSPSIVWYPVCWPVWPLILQEKGMRLHLKPRVHMHGRLSWLLHAWPVYERTGSEMHSRPPCPWTVRPELVGVLQNIKMSTNDNKMHTTGTKWHKCQWCQWNWDRLRSKLWTCR